MLATARIFHHPLISGSEAPTPSLVGVATALKFMLERSSFYIAGLMFPNLAGKTELPHKNGYVEVFPPEVISADPYSFMTTANASYIDHYATFSKTLCSHVGHIEMGTV